jgi:uncharacterized membrane protein HdeD (DUF308 family)
MKAASLMEVAHRSACPRDILSNPWLVLVLFGLPIIAIAIAGRAQVSNGWRTIVWTIALAVMGATCVVNAVRCGRVHCYLTGPFFLLMAVVTLLFGIGIVPLGRNGWNLIRLSMLAGAIMLCCVPELILGKYNNRTRDRYR